MANLCGKILNTCTFVFLFRLVNQGATGPTAGATGPTTGVAVPPVPPPPVAVAPPAAAVGAPPVAPVPVAGDAPAGPFVMGDVSLPAVQEGDEPPAQLLPLVSGLEEEEDDALEAAPMLPDDGDGEISEDDQDEDRLDMEGLMESPPGKLLLFVSFCTCTCSLHC